MRPSTIEQRRRLYLLARVVIARHYRRPLTLEGVSRALACSPRQLTRVYAQFGEVTFREDLLARRLHVAAQLLVEQYVGQALKVADYVYVLNRGRITFAGRPEEVSEETIMTSYLGSLAQ